MSMLTRAVLAAAVSVIVATSSGAVAAAPQAFVEIACLYRDKVDLGCSVGASCTHLFRLGRASPVLDEWDDYANLWHPWKVEHWSTEEVTATRMALEHFAPSGRLTYGVLDHVRIDRIAGSIAIYQTFYDANQNEISEQDVPAILVANHAPLTLLDAPVKVNIFGDCRPAQAKF